MVMLNRKSAIVAIAGTAILLSGCFNSAEERFFPALPEALAECRAFYLSNSRGDAMMVMRCPNSVTTTKVKAGKTSKTTVVIDGAECTEANSAGDR